MTAHGVCLLRSRRGITLLELLVVMLILLMVTAAAIPIIAPAMQNRQMREATRLVTSFLGAAKARAVQTGRPVGVMIERFNGNAFAFQMSQVEVPPPYSGDVVGARLTIEPHTGSAEAQENFGVLFPGKTAEWFKGTEVVAGMLNTKLLRAGDQIQLNSHGPLYVILGPDAIFDGAIDDISATTPLEFAYIYTPPLKQAFPWKNTSPLPTPQAASYQIFRQPIRTSSPPLQLPDGIVFDLSVSCVGTMPFNATDYSATNVGTVPGAPTVRYDPQIIFSPSGRVEWVTMGTSGELARTAESVYLLLGRRELMYDVTNRADPKDIVFQNLSAIAPVGQSNTVQPPVENFWITVSPQTGLVQTAPMAPHLQDWENLSGNNLNTHFDVLRLALWGVNPAGNTVRTGACSFAKESQSLGGR